MPETGPSARSPNPAAIGLSTCKNVVLGASYFKFTDLLFWQNYMAGQSKRIQPMHGKFTLNKETEYAPLDWGRIGVLCSPGSTGARQLTILDGKLLPGKGHDFHKHAEQEEVILVISGSIEQWIDKEKRVLGPGDSVFIPPNVVHGSFNVSDRESNIVAIFGPSVGENGFEMIDMSGEAPWNSLRQ